MRSVAVSIEPVDGVEKPETAKSKRGTSTADRAVGSEVDRRRTEGTDRPSELSAGSSLGSPPALPSRCPTASSVVQAQGDCLARAALELPSRAEARRCNASASMSSRRARSYVRGPTSPDVCARSSPRAPRGERPRLLCLRSRERPRCFRPAPARRDPRRPRTRPAGSRRGAPGPASAGRGCPIESDVSFASSGRSRRSVTRNVWPCASCRTSARGSPSAFSLMSAFAGIITRAIATCGGRPTSKSTSLSPDHGSCQRNSMACRPGGNVPRSFAAPPASSTP